jgi:hypothetical protein
VSEEHADSIYRAEMAWDVHKKSDCEIQVEGVKNVTGPSQEEYMDIS